MLTGRANLRLFLIHYILFVQIAYKSPLEILFLPSISLNVVGMGRRSVLTFSIPVFSQLLSSRASSNRRSLFDEHICGTLVILRPASREINDGEAVSRAFGRVVYVT